MFSLFAEVSDINTSTRSDCKVSRPMARGSPRDLVELSPTPSGCAARAQNSRALERRILAASTAASI
jgi:hypothetical protein